MGLAGKKGKKIKHDRLLRVSYVGDGGDRIGSGWPQEMLISGDLDLGKNGNPVTILVEDEVTGEQIELSGVRNAFLVLEDTRKTSSGWLALAVGSIEKMADVLGFLSQTTLEAIKKLTTRG